MTPSPIPHRRRFSVEALVPFLLAGLVFGLLYNTLFYPRTLIEYAEAGTIGLVLGTAAGVAEQLPALRRWFHHRSFLQAMFARTVSYSVAVALTLSLVLSVEPASEGVCRYGECVLQYMGTPAFLRDLVFTTGFVFLAIFSAQVVLLVGTRNFGRLVLGRYRTPRELNAEFMFVDLRGSTGIAEALGHDRFSSFLRDFFIDVSGPIQQSRGEVYQYVGDEVVIVWPGKRAEGRWLDCFLQMRASLESERSRYLAEYGFVPEFKAGVHAGMVVGTEVGTVQRAHVYHGDVLNAAARIQAKCNETGYDLLVSREALSVLSGSAQAGFRPLGPMSLRGRAEPMEVFGLSSARPGGGESRAE